MGPHHHAVRGGDRTPRQRELKGTFPLVERVAFASLLALLLVFALTRNPVWGHLEDLGPVSNTLLAFFALFIILTAGTLVPRQPLLSAGVVTALMLAFVTYPWSELRWEVSIIESMGVELTDEFGRPAGPHLVDWAAFAAPVLLLVFVPVLLQVRAISERYREKGAQAHEIDQVRRHLFQEAGIAGGATLVVVVLLGLLLQLAVRLPAGALLRENPLVVLLTVTLLLLAAIGVGTGLLTRPRSRDRGPRAHSQAQRS